MDEIVSILDRFIRRPSLSKQTIEEILDVSLQPQPNNNPYWNFYGASCTRGPFATVQYREPGAEATSQTRGVILTIRSELQVTEIEVRAWYGPGTIGQIIPEALSEGLVVYKYEREGQELSLAYHGQSYRLNTVTFWR